MPPNTKQKKPKMLLALGSGDRALLEELIERYRKSVARPNKAWVLRQLIRNAHRQKSVPPVIVGDESDD